MKYLLRRLSMLARMVKRFRIGYVIGGMLLITGSLFVLHNASANQTTVVGAGRPVKYPQTVSAATTKSPTISTSNNAAGIASTANVGNTAAATPKRQISKQAVQPTATLVLSSGEVSLNGNGSSADITAELSNGAAITIPSVDPPFYAAQHIGGNLLHSPTQTFFLIAAGASTGTYTVQVRARTDDDTQYTANLTVRYSANPTFTIGSIDQIYGGVKVNLIFDAGYDPINAVTTVGPQAMSPDGHCYGYISSIATADWWSWICGNPNTPAGSYQLTLVATDRFGTTRTKTTTWNWQP